MELETALTSGSIRIQWEIGLHYGADEMKRIKPLSLFQCTSSQPTSIARIPHLRQ